MKAYSFHGGQEKGDVEGKKVRFCSGLKTPKGNVFLWRKRMLRLCTRGGGKGKNLASVGGGGLGGVGGGWGGWVGRIWGGGFYCVDSSEVFYKMKRSRSLRLEGKMASQEIFPMAMGNNVVSLVNKKK